MTQLALLLIALVGFANQRGSTCAVSAADEIVREGQFNRIAGFALAAAVRSVVMGIAGSAPRLTASATLLAASGGVLAALGVSLNGRCAMGTVASLSRGRLDRLGTLAGFLLGVWLTLQIPALPKAAMIMVAPPQALPMLLGASIVALVAWRLASREGLPAPGWMVLIGLLNAALLIAKPDWTYTGGLTSLARGDMAAPMRLALDLGLVLLGGVSAAKLSGTLEPRLGGATSWLTSLGGGILMGAGSALVPGGNDTMLLVGVPLLLPGLLVAYASFWAALLALRWHRARWTS